MSVSKTNVHDFIWCTAFLPALLGYLFYLTQFINTKPQVGLIERFHADVNAVFSLDAKIELLSSGFHKLDGLAWVNDEESGRQFIVCADIGTDMIWKWEAGIGLFTVGKTLFRNKIDCSVKTNDSAVCFRESFKGASGLIRSQARPEIEMLICERGLRKITRLFPNGSDVDVVNSYMGDALNGPVSITLSDDNTAYFTDPSDEDGKNGAVYMIRILSANNVKTESMRIVLVDRSLRRPYGIAYSSKKHRIYVSNADVNYPIVKQYKVNDDGSLYDSSVFFDLTKVSDLEKDRYGDALYGIKIDSAGNLFVACKSGVLVVSPNGDLIGRVLTVGYSASNVELSDDGYLFIAAGDSLFRVKRFL